MSKNTEQTDIEDLSGAGSLAADEELPHADERWLVSYADMMTLLFGLFVMLYALAMENKGKIDGVLTELSGQHATTAKDSIAQGPEAELSKLKVLLAGREKQVTEFWRDLQQTKRNLVLVTAEKAELEGQINELKSQRSIASTDRSSEQVQKMSLEKKKLEEKVQSLEQKMKSVEPQPEKSFMLVMLKWSEDKHDLDLGLADPAGKVFNFDHRTFPKHPGNLLVDSRTGPGVELWQSREILPGEYTAQVKLYNDYGNAVPSKSAITIVTQKGEFESKPVVLEAKGQRQGQLKFRVSVSGDVEFLSP